MPKQNHTVIAYLSNKQPEELSQYLVAVVTALIQVHKTPWNIIKKDTVHQIRDSWGKFIFNSAESKVAKEMVDISDKLLKRWEDEFPEDFKKINEIWDLIEKEDQEINIALDLQDENRFNYMIIR